MELEKIETFFKFIKKKVGRDLPFALKLLIGEDLGEKPIIEGYIDLTNSRITWLPKNLSVIGSLELTNSSIITLPENLYVHDSLDIEHTEITEIPNRLNIGGFLWLVHTPLAKQYSSKQIERMIKERGGAVYEVKRGKGDYD